MFDFEQPLPIAGMLLGLSSSLHCFGMCSGIAASLGLVANRNSMNSAQAVVLNNLILHSGRIAGYMVAGATVGAMGSGVFGLFDHSLMRALLRWAAAASLGWVGLSMVNVLPFPSLLLRFGSVIGRAINYIVLNAHVPAPMGAFFAGALWGFLPCAMIYAALFYATLTASALAGTVVMLGFAIGTMPSLLSAALGLSLLRNAASSHWLRNVVGIAIVALGIFSVLIPNSTFAAWCHFG